MEESDTFYVFSVNPSAYVMPVNIEEKSVNMIVDSGPSCNMLPGVTLRKMPGLELRRCNRNVPSGVDGSRQFEELSTEAEHR